MRRTTSLSVIAACSMILASFLDINWTIRALSMAENVSDEVLWSAWKAIFLYASVGAVFLIRAFVLSSSRRPFSQIVLSSVLAILVMIGFTLANSPQPSAAVECTPTAGKICFGVYVISRTAWTEMAAIVYPIFAVLRSSMTGVWVLMNDEYK